MAWIRAGRLLSLAVPLSSWTSLVLGIAIEGGGYSRSMTGRADPSLAGYLGVFFLGAEPYVYFYLSNGNDPLSFKALNRGSPIIRPTKGTGGVRDPTIIPGGGCEAGKKWYIIGTDLDIGKMAQRTGSRGIFVWESTDLINWGNERLVVVEEATAGMVWAPEAIWDPAKGRYLVHWASKFYATSDPGHTGSPSNIRIRYTYTSDFKTFTAPQTLIDKPPTNIIDLTFLPLNGTNSNAFLRFMKDETRKTVFVEVSSTGLFGTWTRPGGDSAIIQQGVEGPAAMDGYRPYESSNPASNGAWTASNRAAFPSNLRHESVAYQPQGI
ncbi:glycoside hydrolase family 43 protein [Parathielavia hyrcaniae]|uniref:Glycoside hydrolase family 43 protein n=1 Tax=Parathielavia hyrcaniae TaxID=113614 RepID=A0AAN6T3U4_9PEZI|nr:glycoside hydrolase family 43 protein [Parathielavia hyrcaniae]